MKSGAFAAVIMVSFAAVAAAQDGSDSARAPWVAPARATRVANPVATGATSVATGRRVYREQCLMCHGARGRGDGTLATNLPVHPGDFTSVTVQRQTDGALYWKITEGRNTMPGMRGVLTEAERWSLVNYLRTFKTKS